MFTINLKNLHNAEQTNTYAMLLSANTEHFEIIIPKTYNPVDDDQFLIFWEYHIMAYAGQLLCNFSSEFSYHVPFPNSTQHFAFAIRIKEYDKLAEFLHVLQSMLDEEQSDSSIDFQFKASQYFNEAFENKLTANTWGLLAIANEFLAE